MTSKRTLDLSWLLVLLLVVFAIAPLTYPGFFQAHSGFLPAFNVVHLADAPNWGRAPDPVRGEGKLPYLLAWPFLALTGSGSAAVKWSYGLAFVVGALASYGWLRRWLGVRGGILAAVVYTYLPWHLSTVYVRGAHAEAWLWAFWPLILWAIDGWAESRSVLAATTGLLAMAAALWTQPGLVALSLPPLVAYAVVVSARSSVITSISMAGAATQLPMTPRPVTASRTVCGEAIPLCATGDCFVARKLRSLLAVTESRSVISSPGGRRYVPTARRQDRQSPPAEEEVASVATLPRNDNLGAARPWAPLRAAIAVALSLGVVWVAAWLTPGAPAAFAGEFLWPYQLLSAAWGDGAALAGAAAGGAAGGAPLTLSFQLGLAAVGLGIVALAFLARDWTGVDLRFRRAWVFWAVVLALVVLLALPVAAFVWRISGYHALLSHPWQLLALAGLPLAFLAGSVIPLDRQLARLAPWAGLVAFTILASYPYLAPRFTEVDPGPAPVAMFRPLEAEAPQLMLLEAEVEPPTEITRTLTLTLTWQAVQPVAGDYTVFVHVLGEGDRKAGQRDMRPCDGQCPTSSWSPGLIVVDRHQVALAPDAPPGPYRLATGLYRLDTGERAAVAGREDGTVSIDVP